MKASSVEVGRRADQLLEAAVALDVLLPPSWAPNAGPDEVFLVGLARKIRQEAEILAGRARSAREIDEVLGLTGEQREARDRKDYSKVIPFTLDDDQILVAGRRGQKLEILPGMAHRFKATMAPKPDSPAAAAEAAFDLAITRDAEIAKLARMVPPISRAGVTTSRVGAGKVPDGGIEPRTQEEATTAVKPDSPAVAVGRMALEVSSLRRALVKATRRSTLRGRVLEALFADLRSLLGVYERASADSFQEIRDRAEAATGRPGRDQAAVRAGVIPP